MRYLVTGGAGFIGSNLVEELLKRGESVRVLDNFSTGKRENLREMLDKIELVEGDIRSYHIVREAVEDVDVVFHEAALPSVPRSVRDPITSNEVNVTGTLNMLKAATEAHVKRFVFASSSSVYGDSPTLPKHEGLPLHPLSPYAVTKMTGEMYCRVFASMYGLETVALRYFNVFGPRQDPESQYAAVIPRFIRSIAQGQSPIVFGNGEQSRDFTFVANVVHANILAAVAPATAAGTAMNCACGSRITLNELVGSIGKELGSIIAPTYQAQRPGDILHSLADISRAKELIGYAPLVQFPEGLQKTIRFFRAAISKN